MQIHHLRRWDVSVRAALAIQAKLKKKLILKDSFKTIRTIAGCDLALDLTRCANFPSPSGRGQDEGGAIGAVVRIKRDTKPVFISPGHKISLRSAVRIIIQCSDGFRIPKPTREADRFVEEVKRQQKKSIDHRP